MSGLTTDYLSGLGLSGYGTTSSTSTTTSTSSTATTEDDNTLGQDDFLTMMVTQLNNQDPTEPMDSKDFVAQLAQFSTVAGIEKLSTSFSELSQTLSQNQTLQAATLVGNDVLVPADTTEISEGQTVSGAVNLSASAGNVTVDVCDKSGEVVSSLDLGSQSAGLKDFEWDGKLDDGTAAPAGTYQFKINATTDGTTESLEPMLDGQVQSVSYDSDAGGLMLSVLGLGSVKFSDVYRIE